MMRAIRLVAMTVLMMTVLMMTALMMSALAANAQAQTYCKTLTGEVEGFFRDNVQFTAERSRDEAVKAELARRAEMGREVVEVDVGETSCKAVYPLGLEEWHCVASAKVCVAR